MKFSFFGHKQHCHEKPKPYDDARNATFWPDNRLFLTAIFAHLQMRVRSKSVVPAFEQIACVLVSAGAFDKADLQVSGESSSLRTIRCQWCALGRLLTCWCNISTTSSPLVMLVQIVATSVLSSNRQHEQIELLRLMRDAYFSSVE